MKMKTYAKMNTIWYTSSNHFAGEVEEKVER